MKLIYTPTSPYARKVRMIILEKGLEKEVALEAVDLVGDATMLQAINPLGKVPALITTGGDCLYDSPVLCEFVDSLSSVSPVIPPEGAARWQVLVDQALSDGLVDAAVNMVVLTRFSGDAAPAALLQRWEDAIYRAINEMETRVRDFGSAFDLGQISYVAALEYLEFRFPELKWRHMHPKLDAWHNHVKARPSALKTRPV